MDRAAETAGGEVYCQGTTASSAWRRQRVFHALRCEPPMPLSEDVPDAYTVVPCARVRRSRVPRDPPAFWDQFLGCPHARSATIVRGANGRTRYLQCTQCREQISVANRSNGIELWGYLVCSFLLMSSNAANRERERAQRMRTCEIERDLRRHRQQVPALPPEAGAQARGQARGSGPQRPLAPSSSVSLAPTARTPARTVASSAPRRTLAPSASTRPMVPQRVPPRRLPDFPLTENVASALVIPVTHDELINFGLYKLWRFDDFARDPDAEGYGLWVMEKVLDRNSNVRHPGFLRLASYLYGRYLEGSWPPSLATGGAQEPSVPFPDNSGFDQDGLSSDGDDGIPFGGSATSGIFPYSLEEQTREAEDWSLIDEEAGQSTTVEITEVQARHMERMVAQGQMTVPNQTVNVRYADGTVQRQECSVMMLTCDDDQSVSEAYRLDDGDLPGLAVLDTACARTVHGRAWREAFEGAVLPIGLILDVKPCRQKFVGVGGDTMSTSLVTFPVGIAGVHGEISSNEIDGDIPLLMSRELQRQLGVTIDMERGIAAFAWLGVDEYALRRTKGGHYAVDLLEYGNDAHPGIHAPSEGVVVTDQEHDALATSLEAELLGDPVNLEETIEDGEDSFEVFAGTLDKAQVHRLSRRRRKCIDRINNFIDDEDLACFDAVQHHSRRRTLPGGAGCLLKQIFAGLFGLTFLACVVNGFMTGRLLDINIDGWDASRRTGRATMNRELDSEDPYVLVISHPCSPWGRWAEFNLRKGGAAAATVERHREEQRPCLRTVDSAILNRVSRGRYIIAEHPRDFMLVGPT